MQVSSKGFKAENNLGNFEHLESVGESRSEQFQEKVTTTMTNLEEKVASKQSGVPDSKCCCLLSRKAKIIIASISIFIILLTIGLSVGLTLALKPKVIDVKPSTQFVFDQDKSIMRLTEITVQDKNLFQPNLKFTVYKSEAVAVGGRRLLQQGDNPITYIDTVNFDQEGIIARVFPDNSAQIMVDPEQLISYLNSTDAQVARLLQQIDESNISTQTGTNDWEQLQAQLSKALSSQMNQGKEVSFSNANYVTLQFNPESKVFEQTEDQKNSTKRLLLQKRMLFIKSFFNKIVNVVKQVVKPVVQAVRVAGPVIGAAAGGVIGFVVGGPAGAIAGFKTGLKIGSVAQSVVKACVPNNTLKIKCDGNLVLQEGIKAGMVWGVGKVTGFSSWFDNWNPFKI